MFKGVDSMVCVYFYRENRKIFIMKLVWEVIGNLILNLEGVMKVIRRAVRGSIVKKKKRRNCRSPGPARKEVWSELLIIFRAAYKDTEQ